MSGIKKTVVYGTALGGVVCDTSLEYRSIYCIVRPLMYDITLNPHLYCPFILTLTNNELNNFFVVFNPEQIFNLIN